MSYFDWLPVITKHVFSVYEYKLRYFKSLFYNLENHNYS